MGVYARRDFCWSAGRNERERRRHAYSRNHVSFKVTDAGHGIVKSCKHGFTRNVRTQTVPPLAQAQASDFRCSRRMRVHAASSFCLLVLLPGPLLAHLLSQSPYLPGSVSASIFGSSSRGRLRPQTLGGGGEIWLRVGGGRGWRVGQ